MNTYLCISDIIEMIETLKSAPETDGSFRTKQIH